MTESVNLSVNAVAYVVSAPPLAFALERAQNTAVRQSDGAVQNRYVSRVCGTVADGKDLQPRWQHDRDELPAGNMKSNLCQRNHWRINCLVGIPGDQVVEVQREWLWEIKSWKSSLGNQVAEEIQRRSLSQLLLDVDQRRGLAHREIDADA